MASVMSPAKESRVAVSATKLLINNRWSRANPAKPLRTVNPSTGGRNLPDCRSRCSRMWIRRSMLPGGHSEHGAWRKIPASERGRLLHRLADLIEKNADELAALESLDKR